MKIRHVFSVADVASARQAMQAARQAGLADDDLSLIARADIELEEIPDKRKLASTDFMPAAMRGAATGGTAGLLAGLVAMVFPPLGVTLAGAALLTLGGAALGTWTAALVGSTVEDPVRRRFEEEIEAGRILLVADGEDPALSAASAAIISRASCREAARTHSPSGTPGHSVISACRSGVSSSSGQSPLPAICRSRVVSRFQARVPRYSFRSRPPGSGVMLLRTEAHLHHILGPACGELVLGDHQHEAAALLRQRLTVLLCHQIDIPFRQDLGAGELDLILVGTGHSHSAVLLNRGAHRNDLVRSDL